MGNCLRRKGKERKKYGVVMVLGDLGHSPRMQNHALAITTHTEYDAYFVGYQGDIITNYQFYFDN